MSSTVTEQPTVEPIEESSHVLQRAIVLDRFRTFFTPVPKAGCTSVLWTMAGLAGLTESTFLESEGREVTRALAIHDMRRWPDAFVFGERSEEEQNRVVSEDGWFRFSVVRNPFRRLFSAWQSKILLAEPQFIDRYSQEPWFPRELGSSADVVRYWREFVDAVKKDPALLSADVHWAPQVNVLDLERISYDHLGHVEKMDDTIELWRKHLRAVADREIDDLPRTNLSPIPHTNELFTEEDIAVLSEGYADDLREFGYEPPSGDGIGKDLPDTWLATVDAVVPAIDELRNRHERVADLQQAVKTRRQKQRESERDLKREKSLRREEHRRNKRLRQRLREESKQLRKMQQSRAWKMTAPLRAAGARWRRIKRTVRGRRQP